MKCTSLVTIVSLASILFTNPVSAQYLTLDKLLALSVGSVSSTEEYLTSNNWVFEDASAQTDTTLGKATFAYGKLNFDASKALLWLHYFYSSSTGRKRIYYELHVPSIQQTCRPSENTWFQENTKQIE